MRILSTSLKESKINSWGNHAYRKCTAPLILGEDDEIKNTFKKVQTNGKFLGFVFIFSFVCTLKIHWKPLIVMAFVRVELNQIIIQTNANTHIELL